MSGQNQKTKVFALFIIFCAGIGGMLYGYDIGIINGAILFIQKEIALTQGQISILTAAVLFGGAASTLISGSLANRFGRKTMIEVAAIIFLLGTLLLILSHNFWEILLGRIIGGIGVGIITIVVPLYIAEAAPCKIRGSGVSIFQLFLTGGILVAYLISLFFINSANWRGMFLTSMLPGILLFLGSLMIIESPRWLFLKHKDQELVEALNRTRYEDEVKKDLALLKANNDDGTINFSFKLFCQKKFVIPFLMAFAIAILNQLTGINVLLQLSGFILQHSGLNSNLLSMLGSVSIGLMNFVVTLIAMYLVDKVGRKVLLEIGTAGVSLALLSLAGVAYFMEPSLLQGYLTVAGLLAFIIFFAIGPGVVVWLAISELLPLQIRSVGMSISLAANSLVSAIFAAVFLPLTTKIGYSGIFLICALFSIVYFIISKYFLPETKGKTLEEIEKFFE